MSAQAFAFPALDRGTRAAFPPALDRVAERLGRALRDLLEGFARRQPQLRAEPARVLSADAWRAEQPALLGLSLYRLPALGGDAVVALDADLVRRLLDLYYGGTGAPPAQPAAEFTAAEERLGARLADAVAACFTEAWPDAGSPEGAARETNPAHLSVMGDLLVLGFRVELADGASNLVQLALPAAALDALGGSAAAEPDADDAWRARLADALGGVRLEVRSVLARPTLSVGELLRLSPGDVIPISLPAHVPLLVDGRQFASGEIGERDGHAAVTVERVGMPHRFGG